MGRGVVGSGTLLWGPCSSQPEIQAPRRSAGKGWGVRAAAAAAPSPQGRTAASTEWRCCLGDGGQGCRGLSGVRAVLSFSACGARCARHRLHSRPEAQPCAASRGGL